MVLKGNPNDVAQVDEPGGLLDTSGFALTDVVTGDAITPLYASGVEFGVQQDGSLRLGNALQAGVYEMSWDAKTFATDTGGFSAGQVNFAGGAAGRIVLQGFEYKSEIVLSNVLSNYHTDTSGRVYRTDVANTMLITGNNKDVVLADSGNVVLQYQKLDGADLAHDYFNRDWLPMSFARMRGWMEGAQLQYATSAHYLDHVPMLNLSAAQQELLAGIPDAGLRETARDFMVNRPFRRDYWVRGARRLAPSDRAERLRAQHVILAQGAAKVKLKVSGIQGEASLHEDVYRPILDALADHKPRSLGEIEQLVAARGIHLARIVEAVMMLAGTGALHPAQSEPEIERARANAERLNTRLCGMERYSEDVNCLAAPVTGGALQVGRVDQLLLLALIDGKQGATTLPASPARRSRPRGVASCAMVSR